MFIHIRNIYVNRFTITTLQIVIRLVVTEGHVLYETNCIRVYVRDEHTAPPVRISHVILSYAHVTLLIICTHKYFRNFIY